VLGLANKYQLGLFMTTMSPLICWCQARITCFAARAIIMHDRGALSAAIKRAISISSN
jgi:hypothetical protein